MLGTLLRSGTVKRCPAGGAGAGCGPRGDELARAVPAHRPSAACDEWAKGTWAECVGE